MQNRGFFLSVLICWTLFSFQKTTLKLRDSNLRVTGVSYLIILRDIFTPRQDQGRNRHLSFQLRFLFQFPWTVDEKKKITLTESLIKKTPRGVIRKMKLEQYGLQSRSCISLTFWWISYHNIPDSPRVAILLQHYFHSSRPNIFWDCANHMLIHPQHVFLTYALFGSGAFLSDTFSVGLVGVVGPVEPVVLAALAVFVIAVEPEGLVGVVALNLFTDGVGAFCTNCFSFAFFSSSAAFLKKAMRSLTEPMPPPNGSDGGLPPGRPNLGPWKRHSRTTKKMTN